MGCLGSSLSTNREKEIGACADSTHPPLEWPSLGFMVCKALTIVGLCFSASLKPTAIEGPLEFAEGT